MTPGPSYFSFKETAVAGLPGRKGFRPLSAATGQHSDQAGEETNTGIAIKIYSCHSGEGRYNTFANRFAQAFRPVGATYEVTIFGYTGKIMPKSQKISLEGACFAELKWMQKLMKIVLLKLL